MTDKFLPNRLFWPSELRDLTPFVADNIDVLGAHLGCDLELLRDGTFKRKISKAIIDLLAIDKRDGSKIVIELQVQPADREHLQRLRKYHISHGARVVIWIAETFSPSILDELRAHNEQADAPFVVFANALRVPYSVTGDFEPYFQVMERPARCGVAMGLPDAARCVDDLHPACRFWATYLSLYPDAFAQALPRHPTLWWRKKTFAGLRVAMRISGGRVSVWIQEARTYKFEDRLERLLSHAALFEAKLGVPLVQGEGRGFAFQSYPIGADDEVSGRSWAEWLHERVNAREAALCALLLSYEHE